MLAVVRDLRARGRKRRSGEWTKDGVLRVLKNPLYAGFIAAGEELFKAEHEAIVSREQFERVEEHAGREERRSGAPARTPSTCSEGCSAAACAARP